MTSPTNLRRALLVLGMSACISTLPAQNPQENPNRPVTPDRPSTRSESDSTDRTRQIPRDATQPGTSRTAPGDRDQPSTSGTRDSSRNRTADASESMVGADDQKFIMEAAQGGMMAVQLAQLAQQKASSPDVKEFAKQLEQDHSKANEDLKTLAQQKNVNLPSELDQKHQSQVAKFNNLSDEKFDKEYMKATVGDHKKDVKMFQKHADRGMDSHVKEFAAKTLPNLQAHLQKAEELRTTSTRARKADDTATPKSDDSATKDTTTKPERGQPAPTPKNDN